MEKLIMPKEALLQTKYQDHLEAIEKHKALLEKLHLDSNSHLDEINTSFQSITLTLEEYLKLIGVP
jgi:hypothetical protein